MKVVTVKLTTLEKTLGLSPADEEIYTNFIGVDEEVMHLPAKKTNHKLDELEQRSTVFLRDDDGNPCFYDYQIRGFFKDTCGALSRLCEKDPTTGKKKLVTKSGGLTAYKKVIDGNIFVAPRKITINFDGKLEWCERPLRAMTMQGERVALARSESVPAGATLEFRVLLLNDSHLDILKEWLNYGRLRGLGQWRNSGCGKFKYEILDIQEMPFDLEVISNFH